jgi:hypothetical protein
MFAINIRSIRRTSVGRVLQSLPTCRIERTVEWHGGDNQGYHGKPLSRPGKISVHNISDPK